MPLSHQYTKSHKVLNINSIILVDLCDIVSFPKIGITIPSYTWLLEFYQVEIIVGLDIIEIPGPAIFNRGEI